MGFANFGVVSFTDQSKVSDFVTYFRNNYIVSVNPYLKKDIYTLPLSFASQQKI